MYIEGTNDAIKALSSLKEAGQKAKEAGLKRDIQKILDRATQRGGLFSGGDILFLLSRINQVYPDMTATEQEVAVRRLLQKSIRQETEIFSAEVGRRPGRRHVLAR